MSASAASAGTPCKRWILCLSDAESGDPIPAAAEPFTRLGRSVLEARGRALWSAARVPWSVRPEEVPA